MSMIDAGLDFLQNSKFSPVSFLFKDAGDSVFAIQGTGLAALTVDTVDSEAHDWTNDVSQYAVEGLTDISDNIKQKPDELSVTCFVSNAPITGLIDEVVHFADRFLNGRNRTQQAFNQLKALRDLRVPVSVATRYRVYTNVAITGVTIRRTPDLGDALVFDVRFKQINIVSTQTTAIPKGLGAAGKQVDNATKQRAGVKVDAGKSTGQNVKVGEGPKSVNKSIGAVFGGLF